MFIFEKLMLRFRIRLTGSAIGLPVCTKEDSDRTRERKDRSVRTASVSVG